MKKTLENLIADRFFCVLALVSGFMVYLMGQGIGFTIGPDGNDYVGVAFQLFDFKKYGAPTDYVGPFYAAFLRVLFALGGGWVFPIFHHYLPAFFVPLIVYFALKPFYQPAAFFCGLFLALDVNSMFHFSTICSEAPYIFWLAVVLWSFCRLLRNPQNPMAAYGHGLSLVMLTLTRAAGRFLFIVLLPFYAWVFRSKKTLIRLILIFFIPLIAISLIIKANVPLLKFPSAIVPLTFLRSYGMVNPESKNLHRMMEEAEKVYFERPLSPEARQLLFDDLLDGNWRGSNLLFDVAWSEHPPEFDAAVSAAFWEAATNLKPKNFFKIMKIYRKGIYVHSEFTPVTMIYTNIFPYEGERPPYVGKAGVESRISEYQNRYGVPIRKALVESFYKKYCPTDYHDFNLFKPHAWATIALGRISIIFPFLVQRWVFFLAVFFLFVRGREEKFKEYRTVAVFGLILFIYNFALTMLFGPHERYRAPMDMFYFIPTAWLYAFLIFDKNWKSPWKITGWVLLIVMIIVNIAKSSDMLRDYYLHNAFLRLAGG